MTTYQAFGRRSTLISLTAKRKREICVFQRESASPKGDNQVLHIRSVILWKGRGVNLGFSDSSSLRAI